MPKNDLYQGDEPEFFDPADLKQSTLDRALVPKGKCSKTQVTIPLAKDGAGVWKACLTGEHQAMLKLESYVLTHDSYRVFRFTVRKEDFETTTYQIALFSRKEWAVEYLRHGRVFCQGDCLHEGQCKQIRHPFSNTSPKIVHGYLLIGKGTLLFGKRNFEYQETIQLD